MKKLVPTLIAVAALLLIGALLKQAWGHASVKGRLQQQGVWIARYLSVSDYDLQGALNQLKSDRPMEITDSSIWEQVITNPKDAPADAIIVVCKQTADGRQLVIRRNQSVNWIPAADGRCLVRVHHVVGAVSQPTDGSGLVALHRDCALSGRRCR